MVTKNKYSAMARHNPGIAMVFLYKEGLLVGDMLDFGSGRGYDAEYYGMDKYDPNWTEGYPQKKYDTITCNYVLNVVSEDEQNIIIEQIKGLLKKGGKAYITVRRMKKEYSVKDNMREYMQRNVYLPFKSVFKSELD